MAKKSKVELLDEPGAEDRFLRGINKALKTRPKPHKQQGKEQSRATGSVKESTRKK